MRRRVFLLGLWLALAGGAGDVLAPGSAARAEGESAARRVVVELYTAQGCSSCPPADRMMADLARDPRVIALALHVDYWDYLGWKDAFAQPRFTARQKAYARVAGERMVYTPQMIVDGTERIVGARPAEVAAAIARQAARPARVRLTLAREEGRIVIRAESVPPEDRALRIDLVRYVPQREVTIGRGENAGLVMTYRNVVSSWQPLADWRAVAPIEIEAPATGGEPAVVLIQSEGPREIVAAAALE